MTNHMHTNDERKIVNVDLNDTHNFAIASVVVHHMFASVVDDINEYIAGDDDDDDINHKQMLASLAMSCTVVSDALDEYLTSHNIRTMYIDDADATVN